MAKARPGVPELLLPPPTATQLGFQVIKEFMLYTDCRIIIVFTKKSLYTP